MPRQRSPTPEPEDQSPVKTREGDRIVERAGRALLLACIRETFWRKHELSQTIRSLQARLQSELQADDYLKVTRLGYAAVERTHSKAKMNQIQKLERLMDTRDKSCARCPTRACCLLSFHLPPPHHHHQKIIDLFS